MQRKRSGRVFLILGVLLAVIAFFLVFVTLQNNTKAKEVETRTVFVAARDIPERVTVREADLTAKAIPVELVPADAISSKDQAIGQIAGSPILMGEIIRATRLAKTTGESGAAYTFEKGEVAVSLGVNSVSGVAGLVKPGDFVDVLISLDLLAYDLAGNESKERHVSQVTLQDVKVLSVGVGTIGPGEQSDGKDSGGSQATETVVTLLLSRQDALTLKFARETGAVDLALRSAQDHETVTTDAVYLEYLTEKYKLPMPPVIVDPNKGQGAAPSQSEQGGQRS